MNDKYNILEDDPIEEKSETKIFEYLSIAIKIILVLFFITFTNLKLLASDAFTKKIVPITLNAIIICFFLYIINVEKLKNNKKINVKKVADKACILIFIALTIVLLIWMNDVDFLTVRLAKKDYLEVEGFEIPTFYKYIKKGDNVLLIKYFDKYQEENITASFFAIHFKYALVSSDIITYKKALLDLGYKRVTIRDNSKNNKSKKNADYYIYVLNNEGDNSFQYVYIGDYQVKYGVCTSGYYEKVLEEKMK